jgi:predicted nucleic acid-binding protein
MRVVLDTNVWLDVLVFDDPATRALKQPPYEIVIDEACEAELERVLAYPLGKWSLDDAQRAACLGQCSKLAVRIAQAEAATLPRCEDPDDQKFLVLASAAGAQVLVTKDAALLRLRRKVPFRIARPEEL